MPPEGTALSTELQMHRQQYTWFGKKLQALFGIFLKIYFIFTDLKQF